MNNQNLSLEESDISVYNSKFGDQFANMAYRYPHIADAIEVLWQDKNMLTEYLRRILMDTRGHSRHGFDKEAYACLMSIYVTYAPDPKSHIGRFN